MFMATLVYIIVAVLLSLFRSCRSASEGLAPPEPFMAIVSISTNTFSSWTGNVYANVDISNCLRRIFPHRLFLFFRCSSWSRGVLVFFVSFVLSMLSMLVLSLFLFQSMIKFCNESICVGRRHRVEVGMWIGCHATSGIRVLIGDN